MNHTYYHFVVFILQMEDKRRILHKNLDLMESIEALNKWCLTASEHLDRDEDLDRPPDPDGGEDWSRGHTKKPVNVDLKFVGVS